MKLWEVKLGLAISFQHILTSFKHECHEMSWVTVGHNTRCGSKKRRCRLCIEWSRLMFHNLDPWRPAKLVSHEDQEPIDITRHYKMQEANDTKCKSLRGEWIKKIRYGMNKQRMYFRNHGFFHLFQKQDLVSIWAYRHLFPVLAGQSGIVFHIYLKSWEMALVSLPSSTGWKEHWKTYQSSKSIFSTKSRHFQTCKHNLVRPYQSNTYSSNFQRCTVRVWCHMLPSFDKSCSCSVGSGHHKCELGSHVRIPWTSLARHLTPWHATTAALPKCPDALGHKLSTHSRCNDQRTQVGLGESWIAKRCNGKPNTSPWLAVPYHPSRNAHAESYQFWSVMSTILGVNIYYSYIFIQDHTSSYMIHTCLYN